MKFYNAFISLILILSLLFLVNITNRDITFPDNKTPIVNENVVNIGGYCSGIIVKLNVILTAAHCIKTPPTAVVIFYDHSMSLFEVRYVGETNTHNDFAILTGDTKGIVGLPLADKEPTFLQGLTHFGYSGTMVQWMTPGIYLSKITYSRKSEWYFVCHVIPGDSGGGVVGLDSKVYGIAYASYWPINVSLALMVPAYLIQKQLNRLNL